MKYVFLIILCFVLGCKKLIQVDPPITAMVSSSVFTNNLTAGAAVSGLLNQMALNNTPFGGGENGISALLGLSADDFELLPTTKELLNLTYLNALQSNMSLYPMFWNYLYNYIYQANAVIEGLEKPNHVSYMLRQQLIGEAKFIRALCHFYLVNIYGDVPLITTTDYRINAVVSRTPEDEIYKKIIADLIDAQSLLTVEYRTPLGGITVDRVRPNKAAVAALLSRVYLFIEEWAKAEEMATRIITNEFGQFSLSSDLSTTFTKASSEAIFQLEMNTLGFNTPDAALFLLNANGGPNNVLPFTLSNAFVSQFDSRDLRRKNWIDSKGTYFFPSKYKLHYTPEIPANEYPVLFRLAEQYLIRAEARAKQNNLIGAISDLNVIKIRAGLPSIEVTQDISQVIKEIFKERQLELFTEYGHRWMDLKRSNLVDSVMTVATLAKGGTWHPYSSLYPIPFAEIDQNPNLTQNIGY